MPCERLIRCVHCHRILVPYPSAFFRFVRTVSWYRKANSPRITKLFFFHFYSFAKKALTNAGGVLVAVDTSEKDKYEQFA